ncbi:MAG: flagellar filament capping protein FliD, partial [Candidatus Eremiobacteraeota bacterium]|nr:flagellar filament capping protein FliD [Candidatus Eremiobacteraeota bacterium]
MSGISSVNSSSSADSGTLGNVAPISFPGIASGIDYNAIIQKLTSLTLAQNKPLQDQATQLSKANAELAKIKGLIQNVQQAITGLADPTLFSNFSATSSNTAFATATQIAGSTPTAGATTILSQTLATSTQVTADPAANKPVNTGVSLATAGFQFTPSNGGSGSGTFTVNGQQITFDVSTDTVNTIVTKLNALAGVTASFAGDKLTVTSTSGPLSLGSVSDKGNLAQIFKLDTAQITGGGTTVTSAGTVGGVNPTQTLATANLTTPLNGGNTFSINGVAISINPATQSLDDILTAINASAAGVSASFNTVSGQLQLVAKNTGPSSIVLGAPGDSSNFLQSLGLTTAGATTLVGQQASVTFQTPSGGSTTVFSSSNQVTSVIPGITLNLQQNDAATPYTVTVASDPSKLESSINSFITAYNKAIDEINSATAAPVVQTATPGTPLTPGQAQSQQVTPAGVLFDNQSVQGLKDQLVSLTTSLVQNNSTSYNSLASIGVLLDTSV